MPQTFCLIASVFWRRLDARPVTPVFCKGLSWSICLLTKESALATSHNKQLSGKAWGIFRHRSSSRYQSSGFSAGTISLRLAFSKRHVDKSCTECRPMRASTAFNTVVLELMRARTAKNAVLLQLAVHLQQFQFSMSGLALCAVLHLATGACAALWTILQPMRARVAPHAMPLEVFSYLK